MKSLTAFLSLLATANSAAVLQPRQLGFLAGAVLSKQAALKVEQIPPVTTRPGAKRVRMRWGPYTLRAKGDNKKTTNGQSMDPAGSGWSYLADKDFPRDVTLLVTDANVVFENGKRASISDNVYNHHLVFFNMDKTVPSVLGCGTTTPGRAIPMSIVIGGAEDKGAQYYSTPDGKFNSGYYIGKNDKIMMSGDVVNYKNVSQTVYTEAEIEYVEGQVKDALEANQQVISVGMCDGKGVILEGPKGQTKFALKGKEMTITRDGYFVTAKGHLHDGGVNLVMKLNGKEICNTKAEYGGADATMKGDGKEWKTISQMTYCPGPVKVAKGDKLSLEANYDLEQHPARQQHGGGMAEEMALVGASFAVMPEVK